MKNVGVRDIFGIRPKKKKIFTKLLIKNYNEKKLGFRNLNNNIFVNYNSNKKNIKDKPYKLNIDIISKNRNSFENQNPRLDNESYTNKFGKTKKINNLKLININNNNNKQNSTLKNKFINYNIKKLKQYNRLVNQINININNIARSVQRTQFENYINHNFDKSNVINLNVILNDKLNDYNNQIENFFNGVDNEVELNVQKLKSNKKKANKMLEEFNKMKNEINLIEDDKKICLYKKEKDSTILENKQFLSDIENFLKENLNKTKQKVLNEENNFNNKCDILKKNIESYENSVINTMISGIPNICMRIRRFKKYTNSKSKYFKTDSLCMLVSNTINLAGFAICGLIYDHNQSDFKYTINLKIYELDNIQNFSGDNKEMISINVDIPMITNIVDPVFQFYLPNSVTISKNKMYFIIIKNLSNLTFVNSWTGNVGKEYDEKMNQSSVISNNSNVKFNFLNAFGVESDFNEFTEGIISDVIFSQID
jgi:hypothetical protein